MEDNSKTNGVGHNSALFSEALADGALAHAVKFIDRLSSLVRFAEYEISRAINGKNAVVRAVGVRDAHAYLQKLEEETEDWHAVIENMKQGKDVHLQENCKGSKLEIVAGSEHEFGQYLINQSSPKFCEENTEGKDYIDRATASPIESKVVDFLEGRDHDSN